MLELLSSINFNQTDIIIFFLLLTRWFMLVTLIPFFGSMVLPALVKIALCLSFSVISFFLVSAEQPHEISLKIILLLFTKEALIGFIFGFLVSVWFYAYEYAGQLMDLARGASMSQMFVPEMKHQSSPLGSLIFQLFLVIFLSLKLHIPIIKSIYESFDVFPVLALKWPSYELVLQDFFKIFTAFVIISIKFALPVMLVCFLIDWGFGLINRAAPQINAYFLSLPTKIIAGIIMLIFILPLILDYAMKEKIIVKFLL